MSHKEDDYYNKLYKQSNDKELYAAAKNLGVTGLSVHNTLYRRRPSDKHSGENNDCRKQLIKKMVRQQAKLVEEENLVGKENLEEFGY